MKYIFVLLLVVVGVAVETFSILRNNKKSVDKADKIIDILTEE